MILLIDNYDSFSYNLYQMIGSIEPDIKVIRNDELTVDEIRSLHPDRIILSPGPGDTDTRSMSRTPGNMSGFRRSDNICIGINAWKAVRGRA